MSDPVSNSEIEDVLASIRRLVSENAKALKRDGERDPEAEKLVLTPAFRIDESEAPAQVSDVFAVDTETWNDALGRVEQAENADIFSKETQAHDATSKAVAAPVEAAADPAGETPGQVEFVHRSSAESAPAEDVALAGESADEAAAVAPGATEQADGGAESIAPETETESPDETALERRIAELEAAVDLSAQDVDRDGGAERHQAQADGEPGDDAADMTLDEADDAATAWETDFAVDETAEAAEAVAESPEPDDVDLTDAPAANAVAPEERGQAEAPDTAAADADAPPRSWIEGLVAAAASAEATRLADRAVGADDTDAPSDETSGEIASEESETAAAVDDSDDVPPVDELETAADELAEGDEGEPEASEPFALTEAHEVAPEVGADTELDEATQEETAAQTLEVQAEAEADAVTEDEDASEAGAADDTAVGEAPDTAIDVVADLDTAQEDAAEPVDPEAEAPMPAETGAEPTPERSWVDRLIAAAATLRGGPAEGAGETGEDQPAADLADEATEADVAADQASVAEADETAVEDLGDGSEPPAETMAEPDAADQTEEAVPAALSLDNPIKPDVDPELEPETAADEADAAPGDTGSEESAEEAAAEEVSDTTPLQWEPVETSEVVDTDEAAPVIDSDTVLTGPWSAKDVVADEPDEADDEATEPEAARAEDAETAGNDASGARLEWERVEPQDDTATAPATLGAFAAAAGETESSTEATTDGADGEISDGVSAGAPNDAPATDRDDDSVSTEGIEQDTAIDAKTDQEDFDYQEDSEPVSELVGDALDADVVDDGVSALELEAETAPDAEAEPDGSLIETAPVADEQTAEGQAEDVAAAMAETPAEELSPEPLDEDAAAVAAAAEADWEEAGLAASGLAMAGAAVVGHLGAEDLEEGEPDFDRPEVDQDVSGEGPLDDETVIDEAMLRELVAQLVRDELQGTVGERITHNVRRLIRREIARALTLQDFEK